MTFLFQNCATRVIKFVINVNLRACSTMNQYVEVPSALHLLFEHKKIIFQAVSPSIDNIDYFDNISKLQLELRLRGIERTIDYLQEMRKNCQLQLEISEKYEMLKMERNTIHNQIRLLKDNEKQEEKILLQKRLQECCEQLDVLKEKVQDLEKDFILPYLNLPSRLHQFTTSEDDELNAYYKKPLVTSNLKSHLSLCLQLKEISIVDVSRNSCYLIGNLAILELAVTEFVLSYSKKMGFRPLTITDFAKAVLAEGCGIDVKNNDELFEIHESDCVSSSLKTYLVGGASIPCAVTLICKLVRNPNFVQPFKSVSIGRKYTPVKLSQSVNLYTTPQSTSASAFILHSCHSQEENKMFDEAIALVRELYEQLGLHFILKRYAASKLKKHESLAVGVCMFSPYTNSYTEVGRISLCGDYISRRLQCIEGLGQKRGAYFGMIHIEIINITKWIACMVENTQTSEGNYLIPKCLKPFMFEAKCFYC